jgi:hypothetical protein
MHHQESPSHRDSPPGTRDPLHPSLRGFGAELDRAIRTGDVSTTELRRAVESCADAARAANVPSEMLLAELEACLSASHMAEMLRDDLRPKIVAWAIDTYFRER